MDLAEGHLAALIYLQGHNGWVAVNLGTGHGTSVLELVKSYGQESRENIPFKFVNNRAGDIAISFAKVAKAQELLAWKAKRNLREMCQSSWLWQLEQWTK